MGHSEIHPPVILLVEDESLIRMGTATMLEDAGYRVLEAGDAQEGLKILTEHNDIAVVVTDVQMPGRMDGLALCEIVGRDYPQIQTLVTSGRAGPSEARGCGARRFLSKPYSSMAIQSAVRGMLARTQAVV